MHQLELGAVARNHLRPLTDSAIHATMVIVLHLTGKAPFTRGQVERAINTLSNLLDVAQEELDGLSRP